MEVEANQHNCRLPVGHIETDGLPAMHRAGLTLHGGPTYAAIRRNLGAQDVVLALRAVIQVETEPNLLGL